MWQRLALSREAELGLEPTSCKYWSTARHSGFSLALVSSCLILHCMFLLELSQSAYALISGEKPLLGQGRQNQGILWTKKLTSHLQDHVQRGGHKTS